MMPLKRVAMNFPSIIEVLDMGCENRISMVPSERSLAIISAFERSKANPIQGSVKVNVTSIRNIGLIVMGVMWRLSKSILNPIIADEDRGIENMNFGLFKCIFISFEAMMRGFTLYFHLSSLLGIRKCSVVMVAPFPGKIFHIEVYMRVQIFLF